MPNTQPLCSDAELNFKDSVLGDVEKSRFIALPAKGDTVGLWLQNCVSQPGKVW